MPTHTPPTPNPTPSSTSHTLTATIPNNIGQSTPHLSDQRITFDIPDDLVDELGSHKSDTTLWAAVAGPAVTAAVVAGLVSLIQITVTGRRERNKQLLEFNLRQINELYAPILFHLAQDLSSVETLRQAAGVAPGTEWHILDNLVQVRGTPALRGIAENIVKTNSAIKEILMKNTGLSLETELPQSYKDFIGHADLVSEGVDTGTVPANVTLKYFPPQFETDIRDGYANATATIQKMM